jgi:hypothetical protein
MLNAYVTQVMCHAKSSLRAELVAHMLFVLYCIISMAMYELCSPLQVREQIADEWRADLKLVEHENTEMQRHHIQTLNMDKEDAAKSRQMVFDHDPFSSNKSPYRGKNYK